MGSGIGLPGIEDQLRELGLPVVSRAERFAQVRDTVAPFMPAPDTDQAAMRAIDSLAILPADTAAATAEIQRRREEIGFSYFVFGAGSAHTLAPVVAALAGH